MRENYKKNKLIHWHMLMQKRCLVQKKTATTKVSITITGGMSLFLSDTVKQGFEIKNIGTNLS